MTAEIRPVTVLFEAGKLILELHHDAEGAYHVFPGGRPGAGGPGPGKGGTDPGGDDPGPGEGGRASFGAPRVALSLEEALHACIRPAGTAETVLRAWAQGEAPRGPVALVDPAAVEPVRVRAGAVVIRDGAVLLIRFTEEGCGSHYELPGGGVEAGETLEAAALRELGEETGLAGTVGPEVARVWKDGRHEHYFPRVRDRRGRPARDAGYLRRRPGLGTGGAPARHPAVAPAAVLAHRALAPDGVARAPGRAGRLHHGTGTAVRVVRTYARSRGSPPCTTEGRVAPWAP